MREPVREAVVTIQGGGVFGLSLLGQLDAVLNRVDPLAFAGTSAGALIATLVWGRLKPTEIQVRFERLAAAEGDGLASLLGDRAQSPKQILAEFEEAASIFDWLRSGDRPNKLPTPTTVAWGGACLHRP